MLLLTRFDSSWNCTLNYDWLIRSFIDSVELLCLLIMEERKLVPPRRMSLRDFFAADWFS